jgi:hypothetical protein
MMKKVLIELKPKNAINFIVDTDKRVNEEEKPKNTFDMDNFLTTSAGVSGKNREIKMLKEEVGKIADME